MGARTEAVEPPLALALGLDSGGGALVEEVTAGGPAAQAGMRFGDIIVAIDARPLTSAGELRQRVGAAVPGSRMVLEVWRADGDFLDVLRRLAQGGDGYFMYRVGRMHARGTGVVRDLAEALRWYRSGAAAGSPEAMVALAQALIDGRGTDKDAGEGLTWLGAAVAKGSAEAKYRLAGITLEGKLVSRDAAEAVRLYTRAAGQGNTSAMIDLGLMYDNANGVPADYRKAEELYRRAAELGNSAGMVNLGYLYARGRGVAQSDTAAVDWYRRAVADGNPAGMHNLAVMADGGRGMIRDPELAAGLVLQALAQSYDFSYRQLRQSWHSWSGDFRKALQRRLRDAGLYAGDLDGELGEPTQVAIDAYVNRSR